MKRLATAMSLGVLMLAAGCGSGRGAARPGPSNDGAWAGGWTNLVPANHTGQTLQPTSPVINWIDLDILTGNPGRAASDTLTLTLSIGGHPAATASRTLSDGFDGWARFTFASGVHVHPHSEVKIELSDSGAVLFGWRYGANDYADGTAILLGVPNPSFDFRFRVNAP